MDIGSINSKSVINYSEIRELKVPLKQAIEATKKDGFDEIFFKAGGKDYVAYGQGIDSKALKGIPTTFNGMEATITHIDNETNSAGEGAKSALKSVGGKITVGATAVVGAGVGLYGNAIGGSMGGTAASFARQAGFVAAFAVVVGAVGAGITAGVGAIAGSAKSGNIETIKEITK